MWFRSLWGKRPSGCDSSPWVLPSRPPNVTVSDWLIGAESCVTLWEKGLGGMLLVLLLELVFVKRKQIWLQKGSDISLSPPPQKAKWGQLEQILCLALFTAQISSERSIPPLGRVRPRLRLPLPPHLRGQYHGHFEFPSVEQTVAPIPSQLGPGTATSCPHYPQPGPGGREAHWGAGVFLSRGNA